MIRLSTQRFHVQIPLRMDYFEIFNTILKNKNSKAPGDMDQASKGAWLSVVGSLTGCSATDSRRFKSHIGQVDGGPPLTLSPCFLRSNGWGLCL